VKLKETKQVKGTHVLSITEGGISQDNEKKNNAFTNCRVQRERRVRTLKEIKRARVTHELPRGKGGKIRTQKETE